MKLASVVIAGAALLGCQNESKLDSASGGDTKGAKVGVAAPPSGSLEDRVRRLEEQSAKYSEAWDFLQKVYDQQKGQEKAQREQREREEPAADATFAVDIAPDLKGGQVEGPANACVTLVEAWDFA